MSTMRSPVPLSPARAGLIGGLIVLLVGSACGSNAEPDAAPTTSAVDEQQVATGTGVPEALRFRAPLVGGGEIDMSTLAGKPVVLWFWAPY